MKRPFVFVALFCCATCGAWSVAEESSPRRPKLIPFTGDDNDDEEVRPASVETQERVSARVRDDEEKSSGFAWPSLPKPTLPKLPALPKPSLPKLPTWTTTETREKSRMPKEPSTWEKITTSTKSFATKSKQTLMPWTVDDEESSRKKPSGARRTARNPSSSKSKTEKKSFFSSWLSGNEEEKRVETVNDYLALPRVPYD